MWREDDRRTVTPVTAVIVGLLGVGRSPLSESQSEAAGSSGVRTDRVDAP
jgi:hypothetical protein